MGNEPASLAERLQKTVDIAMNAGIEPQRDGAPALTEKIRELYQSLRALDGDEVGVQVPGVKGNVLVFMSAKLQAKGHKEVPFVSLPEPNVEIVDTFDVTVLFSNGANLRVATVPMAFQSHKEEYEPSQMQPQAVLTRLGRDARMGELPEYARISTFRLSEYFARGRAVDLEQASLSHEQLEYCRAQISALIAVRKAPQTRAGGGRSGGVQPV